MRNKELYLIDATAFCYRAFYALPKLTTSLGQPTGAIFGFVNMLNKILKEKKPKYLGVCFDVSRKTFRQEKFLAYKIQRPSMPDELSSQIPFIKRIVISWGIKILEKEGYEADDIIASLVKKAKEEDYYAIIVSSDKDILQLVDEKVFVFSPYKDSGIFYDVRKFQERFGISPPQIVDVIALMGDSVDNIPGIAGIGEKTAIELIKEFGSLENLISNLQKIKREKIRDAIATNIEQIKLNQELVKLDCNLDLGFNIEELKINEPNTRELFNIFKQLEFKKIIQEFNFFFKEESLNSSVIKEEKTDKLPSQIEEIYISCGEKEWVFLIDNKIFAFDKINPDLSSILSNPTIKKIGHDLKRIKVSLLRNGFNLEGIYFDTMLAGYLLNPTKSYQELEELAWDFLNEPYSYLEHKKKLEIIFKLKPLLETKLKEKSLLNLFYELEIPLIEVLVQMELNGIRIDDLALENLASEIEERIRHLVTKIYELAGVNFNINSPKQLQEILFNKLKLPIVKKTKTGASTDEEVLRALEDKHVLVKNLLEYRQLSKLKNTYIDPLKNLMDPQTKKIYSSFNQTATETGRLSSSNPNLQNIPIKTEVGKRIRRIIIASEKDGWILSCDYSQIELRLLAHISKDKNLISAFKENKDIHCTTASLIYGVAENEVLESMRETAKRVNFGIIYGLSAYGLSRDLNIPLEAAEEFINSYFLRYPQVKEYISRQIEIAKKNGFVTTILGRRRYIPEVNSKNQTLRLFAERQAINTPIQGSAADLIKLAMINIHNELLRSKLRSKMIIQVHDELVFDVCEEELEIMITLVREKMEKVMCLEVPLKVKIKKGKNWLELEEV